MYRGKNRARHSATLRELELSHVPERRSVVQAGKDILYPGPCIAVLRPAQLNGLPQLVIEPKPSCLLRFLWSNPFCDCVDDENIRRDLEIGVVSTQDLGRCGSAIRNETADGNTCLVCNHTESVTVRLSGGSIVF